MFLHFSGRQTPPSAVEAGNKVSGSEIYICSVCLSHVIKILVELQLPRSQLAQNRPWRNKVAAIFGIQRPLRELTIFILIDMDINGHLSFYCLEWTPATRQFIEMFVSPGVAKACLGTLLSNLIALFYCHSLLTPIGLLMEC